MIGLRDIPINEKIVSLIASRASFLKDDQLRSAAWFLMDDKSVTTWKKGPGPERDAILKWALSIAKPRGNDAVCLFGVYNDIIQFLSFTHQDAF